MAGSQDHNGADPETPGTKPDGLDFEKLVRDNGRKIFNTAFHMLGNMQDAEDVTQEIFLEAWSAMPGFQWKSEPSTWLYRIAMNVLSDFIRNKKRRPAADNRLGIDELETMGQIPESHKSAEQDFFKMESGSTVNRALMKLPRHYRAVAVLKDVDGYSYKEIAEFLGISIGTVESRLFRAREMLKKLLAESGFHGE